MRFAPHAPYAVVAGAEGERLWAQARGEAPFFDLPVEDVLSQVAFTFPPERFQPFVEAILRRQAVSLHYLAKTGSMFASFSPHTIVKTAFRVHIRGHALWQDGYSMFIDIVPGRVLEAEANPQANYIGMQNDNDWNEFVDIDVRLCPDVPENIVEAVKKEHAVAVDHFVIEGVRRAMIEYVREALEARRVRNYAGSIWTTSVKARAGS